MNVPAHLSALAPEAPPLRTVAVWVPDWPVIAAMRVADLSPHLPAAVMTPQHRVFAANAAARANGIRRGMRKRTAQGHCPELLLLPLDDERDATQFEPVAVAAEQIASGLEVMRPGVAVLPADGAVRYYGGESELIEALIESVSDAGFECQIGIADGILAAVLAAREELAVPAGESGAYLSPKPISELLSVALGPQTTTELSEAISLWQRLGLHTLGDLVALPSEAVAGRFGALGVWAQRLARGLDLRPPAAARPEEEIRVEYKFDPPLYQVEVAVAVGQQLAAQFVAAMTQRGLACGKVRISATTANGIRSRVWRTDDGAIGGMGAASIAQRLRWQLDSWLTTSGLNLPRSLRDVPRESGVDEYLEAPDFEDQPAPILTLEIAAEEVSPASTYQMSLWGGTNGWDARAGRSLSNAQGILGLDQVQGVALRGERTPWQREIRSPFGEISTMSDAAAPWPSALPNPSPSVVFPVSLPVQLLDAQGNPVAVEPRTSQLTQVPTKLVVENLSQVADWAGPWLVPQNWWEGKPASAAYLQLVTTSGQAYLLQLMPTGWEARGIYD